MPAWLAPVRFGAKRDPPPTESTPKAGITAFVAKGHSKAGVAIAWLHACGPTQLSQQANATARKDTAPGTAKPLRETAPVVHLADGSGRWRP